MTIDKLPYTFYHGTTSNYYDSLIKGIDLLYGKKYVDFGMGFYTTSNYEQAKTLSYKRSKRNNSLPMVISYTLDKQLLNDLNTLILDSYDKWAEFVYNNRMRNTISSFHNKNLFYDIVYGNVADGQVGYLTQKSKYSIIDFKEFSQVIKPPEIDSYDQLSFHTIPAVKALSIDKIKIYDE